MHLFSTFLLPSRVLTSLKSASKPHSERFVRPSKIFDGKDAPALVVRKERFWTDVVPLGGRGNGGGKPFMLPIDESPNEDFGSLDKALRVANFTVVSKTVAPVWRTKIGQFRTHYLTKEVAYVSSQPSGQVTMDTEMI
jgi:hypothetical protein